MAIKKTNTQKEEKQMNYDIQISRVKEIEGREDCYRFDMVVNGVKIYGMSYITYTNKNGQRESFCSFPSYKGRDDKFYNICWFSISDELFSQIEAMLEKELNAG